MDVSDEDEDPRPLIEVRLDQGAVELDFRAANWERAVRDLAVSLTSVMAQEVLGSETARAGNIEVWDSSGRLIAAFSARFNAYRQQAAPNAAGLTNGSGLGAGLGPSIGPGPRPTPGHRMPEDRPAVTSEGPSAVGDGYIEAIRECSDAAIRASLLALREPAYPIDFVLPALALARAASRE